MKLRVKLREIYLVIYAFIRIVVWNCICKRQNYTSLVDEARKYKSSTMFVRDLATPFESRKINFNLGQLSFILAEMRGIKDKILAATWRMTDVLFWKDKVASLAKMRNALYCISGFVTCLEPGCLILGTDHLSVCPHLFRYFCTMCPHIMSLILCKYILVENH